MEHPIAKLANDGIKEMLDGADIKGGRFVAVVGAMFVESQQVWLGEVLAGLVEDDSKKQADEIVALMRQQATTVRQVLLAGMSAVDSMEASRLAEQMIQRQRRAARQIGMGSS